ncbi:MAG: serine/threonine protein kinase [Clostridia bacterium]|nr:serine/threonine protein kinase [Clostridia bacterium]
MKETLINPEIVLLFQSVGEESGKTLVNPAVRTLIEKEKPAYGTVFEGGFRMRKALSVESGEADLYLAERDGEDFVVKLYHRDNAVKHEVMERLDKIESPHIMKVIFRGQYHGMPFEVVPYYPNGSLSGKQFDLETIKTAILPQLNEAIHTLHEHGILHKDIKPSNIMLKDDGTVVLIDFGISSTFERKMTVRVTKTGLTYDYSAPEVFQNLYLVESDYYALGITLYELFSGHTPYQHLSEDAIMQYLSLQRIPFPDSMPKELKDLILALTYHDLTARHDKTNPNRRWTYQEVADWLKGEKQVIPGQSRAGFLADEIPPYSFKKKTYTTLPSLVKALGEHWAEGKNELFFSRLSSYFENVNPVLARRCKAMEEEAKRRPNSDDLIFWRLLLQLDPDLKQVYWRGAVYESLSALGRDMLQKLSDRKPDRELWDSILSAGLLSAYLERMVTPQPKLYADIVAIEDSYRFHKDAHHRDVRYYLMAYYLSGQTQLTVDKQNFFTVEELSCGIKRRADESIDTLRRFANRLINPDLSPTAQLEAWLTVLGEGEIMTQWQTVITRGNRTQADQPTDQPTDQTPAT